MGGGAVGRRDLCSRERTQDQDQDQVGAPRGLTATTLEEAEGIYVQMMAAMGSIGNSTAQPFSTAIRFISGLS